jgi:hypothetical protein
VPLDNAVAAGDDVAAVHAICSGLDTPASGRTFLGQLICDNLGRPDRVSVIFGRKIRKGRRATPGRFLTVISQLRDLGFTASSACLTSGRSATSCGGSGLPHLTAAHHGPSGACRPDPPGHSRRRTAARAIDNHARQSAAPPSFSSPASTNDSPRPSLTHQ